MDQTNMPIGVKFAVIHRAFRREMDTLLRQKDLTGAQFGTLRALDCLEKNGSGEISQRQLEEVCHSAHPTMTEILKKLEKKGYLTRRRDPEDQRSLSVALTPAGEALKDEALSVPGRMANCLGLSGEEALQLGKLLDKVLNNIEKEL